MNLICRCQRILIRRIVPGHADLFHMLPGRESVTGFDPGMDALNHAKRGADCELRTRAHPPRI